MAQIDMLCPFTQRLCEECPLYRGRRSTYLGSCKQYRGYLGKAKGTPKSGTNHRSIDFQALRKLVEPWSDAGLQPETQPEIRLKVIDMENGETKVCQLQEAKDLGVGQSRNDENDWWCPNHQLG